MKVELDHDWREVLRLPKGATLVEVVQKPIGYWETPGIFVLEQIELTATYRIPA